MDSSVSIRRAAVVLTAGWLLQMAVSGLVQVFIASRYGTSSSLDIYLAGVTIPSSLFMVFSSSFGIAAILYFNELRVQKGSVVACEKLTIASVLTGFICVVIALVLTMEGSLLKWVTPGLDEQQLQTAGSVLRITSLAIPFLGTSTILQGLLQANHRFYSLSLAGLIQVLFLPSVVLVGQPTPQALAWGFDLGAWVSFAVILGAAVKAGLIKFRWSAFHNGLGRLFALILPLTAAGMLTHMVWVSERHFASFLGAGAISALSYSQRIVNLLGGALTYGLSTVLLPTVSARFEEAQLAEASRLNRKVLLALVLPTIIIVGAIILFSTTLVKVLFERGAFTAASTDLTAKSLTMYTGLLISNVIGSVIMKNVFAAKEGWLNVSTSLFMLIAFVALVRPMISVFGFGGLPLTTSIAFALGLLFAAIAMARKHPQLFRRMTTSTLSE